METEKFSAPLKLYAVVSKDGKFFRAKGYGGGGNSWVDDINKAKIYAKIGPARSCVTWWTNNYPKYGIPDIMEMTIGEYVILDEAKRVEKAIASKKAEEARREIRNLEFKKKMAEEAKERAERDLKEANRKLKSLK